MIKNIKLLTNIISNLSPKIVLDFLKGRATPLIGVDISNTAVKVVELSLLNGVYCLEHYGSEPVGMGDAAVAHALKRVVARLGITTRGVAIAVSGASVFVHRFRLNAGYRDSEILEHVEVHAEQYLSRPLEGVYFDVKALDQCVDCPDMREMILVVADAALVDSRVNAIQAAGLQAAIVDLECFAMERATTFLQMNLVPLTHQAVLWEEPAEFMVALGLALRMFDDPLP